MVWRVCLCGLEMSSAMEWNHHIPTPTGDPPPVPSVIFSLVALYYINQLSHKTYGTPSQPKPVPATKGGKGKK